MRIRGMVDAGIITLVLEAVGRSPNGKKIAADKADVAVMDRNKRFLVGIIALGDFAVESSEIRPAADALSEISKPA